MSFQQAPPTLNNQYEDDRVLWSYLRRVLPAEILSEIQASLSEMGQLAGGELYQLQLADRLNEPKLTQWDAWGNRIDRIELTPLWRVAERLAAEHGVSIATACHAIHDAPSLENPNVVKVALDARGHALYFSRSRIPYPREGQPACYRHAGIYAYRVGFLEHYAALAPAPLEQAEALEQLRALWHGHRIAVVVSESDIPPGVDTPDDLTAVLRMLR